MSETSYGSTAASDIAVCRSVARDLEQFYPGHMWLVGANHEAGTVLIDLPYSKPPKLREFRFMLYISTVIGSDGPEHVRRAGGELLERFGLPRGPASQEAYERALEHGLDADGAIMKSKA